jgi:thiamine biosynthesis lipoprotein
MRNTIRPEEQRTRLLELGLERATEPPSYRWTRAGPGVYRLDAEQPAMGTRVAVRALARSTQRLEDAIGRAYEEMARLIAVFTRYESDSALSVLNDVGRLEAPPLELTRVLGRAGHYHHWTRGAFDVSVAPLVDLFEGHPRSPAAAPPTRPEITAARELVGARHIRASRRAIHFERQGMRVTLDGIAKGYIVDRMAAALDRHRVRHYLVDGGGDLRTRGRNDRGRPWTVAVRDPTDPASFLDTIRPGRSAVATSGSYERYHGAAPRYHHLVDGGSGASPHEARSVSVTAPTAMDADALATAVFILGPSQGLAFLDSVPGCGCLIQDRHGRRITSRGWKSAPLNSDTTE